jgi:C-terminal processing protease CtpA/Prc
MAHALRTTTGRACRGITALFFLFVFSLAAAPASQPYTQIRAWFDQLNDRDAQVRDQAAEHLMGISASDLPILQNVVQDSRPLRPSQKAALREIVTQVYLAGLAYTPDPHGTAFLGLSWGIADLGSDSTSGVLVSHRVPGFSAYRMLRDGDVITAIEEKPGVPMNNASFTEAIQTFHAGQTITLHVVRNGAPRLVAVQLRPRPADIGLVQLEAWISDHQTQADTYWDEHFASLIGDDVS